MNKKNFAIATIAIILSGCAHQGLSRDTILKNEADKIPQKAQAAYFQCEFEKHTDSCREMVWKSHPNPKPETGLDQQFVKSFLWEMDRRGAGIVLQEQGIKCSAVQEAHDMFWQRGYLISCQEGEQYIIDRVNDEWRIDKQPAKE